MNKQVLTGNGLTVQKNLPDQRKSSPFSLRNLRYLLSLLPLLLLFLGGQTASVGATQPTVYYGVHVAGGVQDIATVATFERNAHKAASIVMWYQGWGLQDGTQNFEPTWMNAVRTHGSIPMVTWEPWLYVQGTNQANFSLRSIIDGSHDAYIVQWAKASKVWGHPYFLRFAHEMNGFWYPWSESANGNKAGQYVQAWRHVHDIFTAQGAKNVTWVWCPNVAFPGNIPMEELYPGASYVDWVGMDGYNWAYVGARHQPKTFSQLFQKTYSIFLQLAPNKPMMVAETACTNMQVNEAGWITDAFTVQLPKYFPQIKAVVWFNQNKETDWRIESSATTRATFAAAIGSSRYASNQYANLNISPIPTPLQAAAAKR